MILLSSRAWPAPCIAFIGLLRLQGAILGSGNVIVGFSPAGPAAAAGGSALGKPNATTTPFGLFDSILALIAASAAPGAPDAGTPDATAAGNLAGGTPAPAPNLPPGLTALMTSASPQGPVPGATPEAEAAFGELMQALAALGENLSQGTSPDPTLEAKIAEALEKLEVALGLTPGEVPAIDPAITAAGQVPRAGAGGVPHEPAEAPGDLDPLAAIASNPANTPPSETAPGAPPTGAALVSTKVAPAAPIGAGAPQLAGSSPAEANTGAIPLGEPAPAGAPAQAPSEQQAKAVPAVVRELADRIATLAAALEPHSAGLAKRLTALAEKLSAGEVKPETLGKLGIDPSLELSDEEIARALDRLFGADREIRRAVPPPAFTSPRLDVPEAIATLARQAPAESPETARNGATASTTARTDMMPEAEPDPDIKIEPAPDQRTNARPDKADNAPAKTGLGAAPQTAPGVGDQPPAQAPTLSQVAPLAATAKAAHAAYGTPVRQINIPQIAFEIVRQVEAGASRFHIRLDPPELGRVEVKLDVDASGNVNARMTVERAETLDLMQRDQRALEKALAQAGLDSSKTNLEFSLRQNPFARDGQGGDGRSGPGSPYPASDGLAEADDAAPPPHIVAYRGLASPGGVNLFV